MRLSLPAYQVRRWLRGSGLLAAGGWLAACSGAHEPAQQGTEAHRTLAGLQPTTDVPALLGQSIDRLRRRLGPAQEVPDSFADAAYLATMAPLATDSLVTFRTGGLSLIASYNTHTRQVTNLLLLGSHEDSLMHRAALHTGAPTYLVLPAFQNNRPGKLLGLRIILLSRP